MTYEAEVEKATTDLLDALNSARSQHGMRPLTRADFENLPQTSLEQIAYGSDEPDYERQWEDKYGAPPFWKT